MLLAPLVLQANGASSTGNYRRTNQWPRNLLQPIRMRSGANEVQLADFACNTRCYRRCRNDPNFPQTVNAKKNIQIFKILKMLCSPWKIGIGATSPLRTGNVRQSHLICTWSHSDWLQQISWPLIGPLVIPTFHGLLNWSLGHAEQLLFLCLYSKVDVYSWKFQCFFREIIIWDIITPRH